MFQKQYLHVSNNTTLTNKEAEAEEQYTDRSLKGVVYAKVWKKV